MTTPPAQRTPAATAATPSICMVSDDFLPAATGVGTHLQTVTRHLVERGHRVSLVTTRREGEPEHEDWHGVSVHRVPSLRIAGFDQALPGRSRLARILDAEQPRLVHLHYLGVMMLQAMGLARQRGLPLVYTYHMTEDHLTQPWFMRPLRWPIARGIDRLVNRMDAVVSVSAGVTANIRRRGATVPVHTISNPVDLPDLSGIAPATRDGGFIVMYAGRLEPEKNLPLLLDAFARLAAERPDAVLWIAGRGSQRHALSSQAARLGIVERVRWLGFLDREHLASRYLACDAFVLPSWVETQGLVAMEAAWAGRPVIVADSVVSAEELVDDGVNGWIVPADDPAPMARKLCLLADDATLRSAMGRQGQARAAHWRTEIVLPVLTALYGQIDRSVN